MKVVLCDDHQMMIEALAVVLEARGWTVSTLAVTPAAAVSAAVEHRPDVCVMDVGFPHGDGVAAARAIREGSPTTRVVMLSASTDPAVVAASVAAGSHGFVSKSHDVTDIVDAIERVNGGEVVIEPGPGAVKAAPPAGGDVNSRLGAFLTTREREVLRGLVLGHSTEQLAAEMGVAISTARTHIQNVLVKLGVHSRLEAAALAVRAALVDIPNR